MILISWTHGMEMLLYSLIVLAIFWYLFIALVKFAPCNIPSVNTCIEVEVRINLLTAIIFYAVVVVVVDAGVLN